jgi:tRNA threonylcarbamoyl adenosine modification protein YeaZ
MRILALEFSSAQRSAAVVQGQPPKTLHGASTEVIETGARGMQAFEMTQEALHQAQLEREQIDCMAIGLGPGSYTGIRAAIALAQGWQLAREIKLLGIGSVEAIVGQAAAEGLSGGVAVVIDAQREEFYLATFEVGSVSTRPIQPLRLATLPEVRECQNAGHLLIGPEVTNWFTEGRLICPRASMLGQLALARTDFVSGETLKPIYLRETKFVKAPPPRFF